MNGITVFRARAIATLDPAKPYATHVAVRHGRIVAVGDADAVSGWGASTIDDRFDGHVMLPGFIDGHAHSFEGSTWELGPYVGSFDRYDAAGVFHRGRHTALDVVDGLAKANAGASDSGPLIGWGPEPLLFIDGSDLDAATLDTVSRERPIVVIHASGHMAYLNSAAITAAGLQQAHHLEGVSRGADGVPDGRIGGLTALLAVYDELRIPMFEVSDIESTLTAAALIGQRAGVTTFGDMGTIMYFDPEHVRKAEVLTSRNDFPLRYVAAAFVQGPDHQTPHAALEAVNGLAKRGTEKLRFGPVKMVSDGSIQAFSARLNPPGYYGTGGNGLWNVSPAELREWVSVFHQAGYQIHCHCNGDEASSAFIDTVEQATASRPRTDHRHTVQHGQLIDDAQFARMASLGMGANLFANHLYYWGDAHHDVTLGPERAARMNDMAAALRHGIPVTIHSDAPVTPIGPLFTAWCAANRVTSGGRVLGAERRVSVEEALRAVTIGAAYSLKVDHLVGTIETGKLADFTILEEDPFGVDPSELKDVTVTATVVGGRVFEVDGR